MLHLELSDEEQKVLTEILKSSLPSLDVEIHRTDKLEFKELLTGRRQILKQLLLKVTEEGRVPG
jgi:hypothetical protein